MRITVQDVLGYLAAGMTQEQILVDFPYLEKEDILACLAYATDSESIRCLCANEAALRPEPLAHARPGTCRSVSGIYIPILNLQAWAEASRGWT